MRRHVRLKSSPRCITHTHTTMARPRTTSQPWCMSTAPVGSELVSSSMDWMTPVVRLYTAIPAASRRSDATVRPV